MIEDITLGQVILFGGSLMALGGIIAWALKPVKKLDDRLTKIEKRLDKIDEHLDNDNRKLARNEEDTKQIFKSLLSLIDHSIDNNHTGELKKTKEEVRSYLIGR